MESATDGLAGYRLAVAGEFDVMVLDVRLPRLSGLDLCRRLRSETEIDTPVLMLTAMDSLDYKLNGFSSGADDYLVKPYSLREVEARLLALAKRHKGQVIQRQIKAGDLVYDPDKLVVTHGGEPVRLPPKCIRILAALMQSPGRVFRRGELEAIAWGGELVTSETLRAHMHLLRRAGAAWHGHSHRDRARRGLPPCGRQTTAGVTAAVQTGIFCVKHHSFQPQTPVCHASGGVLHFVRRCPVGGLFTSSPSCRKTPSLTVLLMTTWMRWRRNSRARPRRCHSKVHWVWWCVMHRVGQAFQPISLISRLADTRYGQGKS